MTLSLSIKVPDAQTDELVTKYSAIKDFSYKVERARAVAREFFNTDKLELNADKVSSRMICSLISIPSSLCWNHYSKKSLLPSLKRSLNLHPLP